MDEIKKETEELVEEATEEVVEEVKEEASEITEEIKETTSEITETTEEIKEVVVEKPASPAEPKKKLDKSAKIAIIVGAVVVVIVLACLAFVGIKMGWFGGSKKSGSKVELGDYSQVEVLRSDVDVTEETVNSYITQLLSSQQTTEEQTTGVVALGDTLHIDYEGTYADTGVAFEGGTAQDQHLTIGSGQFISGFEDGLIGKEIGSTVNLPLTFPENYGNSEMAGKAVNFKVTIHSKVVVITPELTDEFVQEYSYDALPKQLNTVAELKDYVADYIYHFYLHDAMMADIQRKAKVISYDEEKEADLVAYSKKSLEYYAAMYGLETDAYAQAMGYASAEEYELEEAHYYMDIVMILDKIIKEKKLEVTEEGLDQCIVEYMGRSGYNQYYDLEEFKEQSGEEWLYLFENLEYKYNLVLEALEPNVTLVDELSEVPTEAAAN
ncbi:MAG: FKBP-type peptidyl-prolyl cis-trans isomerase [Lachnospiraceae bacterium]|nr:FKBP-type peptidyl-prolyl cis-trans isomerase [Lachnospiraceae bacterium]